MKVRAALYLLTPFALSPVTFAQDSARQEHPELGRFSTGPVTSWLMPDDVPGADRPSSDDLRALDPSPPDGTDIRANQVLSSAQNETGISVNPGNPLNWVGVANDYATGNVRTGWYSTVDGGQSFTTGDFGIAPGFSFSGDPCIAFLPDGSVTAVFMQYSGPGGSAVVSHRSVDGGLTWSGSTTVDLNPGNDKPQVDADHSGGPFNGRLTTAWQRFSFPDTVWASTSLNGGSFWFPGQQISGPATNNSISCDVTYGANSELYVMWADRGTFDIWVDRSFDGGQTWGPDVLVAPYTMVPSPIPGSVFRMFDIFSMHADDTGGPHSGNVYIAYHTFVGGQADVRCATSTDQGATWAQNVLVNAADATGADQVMPGVIVDRQGNLNISFYDRRLDPSNFLLWTWVARSSDGGASFSEFRASDVGWNHFPTEFGGTFIGDYIDCDASSGYVYPFWCDGRSGSQDVYADRMNLELHTDVSTISAATGGIVSFTCNIGPNHSGESYILLASISGTSPGVLLAPGVTLQLNFDGWTNLTLLVPNSALFPSSLGVLDGTGSASPGFNTLGPFSGALAGIDIDFAVVAFSGIGVPTYATNPTRVTLVP